MKNIKNRKSEIGNRKPSAFTLIELLVVISIIGVLAAFSITALAKVKEAQYKKVVRAELESIQTALETYKAKYGAYPPANQNPNSFYTPLDRSQFSQLYYELVGVTHDTINKSYTTLDGVSTIKEDDYLKAYGVGGVVNSTKGNGEDDIKAKNCLPNLKENQLNYLVTNNAIRTTMILTSVGGPDQNYKPLGASGVNPIRYVYPGTNSPGSYDLWVQIVIKGKTNLICNWSRQVQINSPLP